MDDAGAELFDLLLAESGDGLELGDGLWAQENDAAQGGGAEDEEEGQAQFFGLGFAPVAEALVEGLLVGREGLGWVWRGGALATEGLGRLGRQRSSVCWAETADLEAGFAFMDVGRATGSEVAPNSPGTGRESQRAQMAAP